MMINHLKIGVIQVIRQKENITLITLKDTIEVPFIVTYHRFKCIPSGFYIETFELFDLEIQRQ